MVLLVPSGWVAEAEWDFSVWFFKDGRFVYCWRAESDLFFDGISKYYV